MSSSDGLLPVYLVIGNDEVKRNEVISRLRDKVNTDFFDFNYDEIEVTPDLEPERIISSCLSYPFGDSSRIVMLMAQKVTSSSDAKATLRKDLADAIVEYLKDPQEQTTLCVVVNSLTKSSKLYKAAASIDSKAIIVCEPKTIKELPSFVVSLAKREGKAMDFQAAHSLVERIGTNELLLERAVKNLCDLAQGRPSIGFDLIEEHIGYTSEVKPWDVASPILEGKASSALELVSHMEKPEQSYLGILACLQNNIRELLVAKSCEISGQSYPDKLTEVYGRIKNDGTRMQYFAGNRAFLYKVRMQEARKHRMEDLIWALDRCLQCEMDIKGRADNKDIAFTSFIIEVANKI